MVTVKRSREQLTDGLSDFFKAVGKRRRCSVPKHYAEDSTETTFFRTRVGSSTAGNNFRFNAGHVASKSAGEVRLRRQFSFNRCVAAVKLRRLPMQSMWELQKPDTGTSREGKPEIHSESLRLFICKAWLKHTEGK